MGDENEVDRWLASLNEEERREVQAPLDGGWDEVELAGTMVEPDEAGAPGTWCQDFYEYAADRKYIFFEERKFHICTRAKSARRALRRGIIPPDFVCSAANPRCPMRRLLARRPGQAVRLTLIRRSDLSAIDSGGRTTTSP